VTILVMLTNTVAQCRKSDFLKDIWI